MPDRSFEFLMTPDEYGQLIWRIADDLGCTLVLDGRGLEIAEVRNSCATKDGTRASTVSFAKDLRDLKSYDAKGGIRGGEWGWVTSMPPWIQDGNILLSGWITIRSHWWDESGQYCDNPKVLELFKEIRKRFRKGLKNRLWNKHKIVNNIWYSAGAEKWFRDGKELGYWYSGPARFSLIEP